MNKAELLEKLDEWKYKLSYYDDAKPGKECPTPEGVKRYINSLKKIIATRDHTILEMKKRIDGLRSWIDKI